MATELSSAPPRPARVQPPVIPGASGLATLAVALVVVVALYFGREVFIPLVLAVLLSFLVRPVVNLLRRIHVPRCRRLVTVVSALAVLFGMGGVIGLQLADLAGKLPQYQQTVETKIHNLQTGVLGGACQRLRAAYPT